MDVPVRDGSTWAKGGFQRNTRIRRLTFFGDQARPPGSDRRAPPVPPKDETEGALGVGSELMQRIDRRSRDRTRLRNEKVRGSNPRSSTPSKLPVTCGNAPRGRAGRGLRLTIVPPGDTPASPCNTCNSGPLL